jgi:hypothetical protein
MATKQKKNSKEKFPEKPFNKTEENNVIPKKIIKEEAIETEEVDESDVIYEEKYPIIIDKIYKLLGYKEKRTIMKILNSKYGFNENIDYKTVDDKTYITHESYIMLCFIAKTDQGYNYRKFIADNILKEINKNVVQEKYEILPIPLINIVNLDLYDNKRVLYVISIKENKYIYGITTDISMIVSLLKEQYTNIIINKIWLLNENVDQCCLFTEINTSIDEDKGLRCSKIKNCFETKNIYTLLLTINMKIKKLNESKTIMIN